MLEHNFYVADPSYITKRREFIWGSYANDLGSWLGLHPSVKCACSGHIHDVERDFRIRDVALSGDPGKKTLLVHNPRGYVSKGHARWFNPDTFVDTKTWKAFETPLTDEEEKARKKPSDEYF